MNAVKLVDEELTERRHKVRAFGVAVDDIVVAVQ